MVALRRQSMAAVVIAVSALPARSVAQSFHVDPKGQAVSNLYGSRNNTQTFTVYQVAGGMNETIVFNCHDDSYVVNCLGYSPSSVTLPAQNGAQVTVTYNVNGTGTGRVALVGYQSGGSATDSGYYNVTGVNSCLSVSSGSVTVSENTTGHQASFTVTNCGTLSDSWTTACDRTGPVACNRISNSCTSAPSNQSCTSTIVYSVGAVGSGTLTLRVTSTNSGNQFSNSDAVTVQAGPPEIAVTTYHYDNYRTGWNQHEQTLTQTNVVPGSFGLLYTIPLDGQVDAQPLVMPHVTVNTGPYAGTVHDVVYVATQNNTVYAIEPATGTVLFSRHFAPPQSGSNYNPTCSGDNPFIGINGTPVIDSAAQTLYAIDFRNENGTTSHHLHALDLGTLNDNAVVTVSASHTLSDGSSFPFNSYDARQRAGLVLTHDSVYAGFASYCDNAGNSRGWLLGWQTPSLTALAANQLNDRQHWFWFNQPSNLLSSIWMSGYGIAADSLGSLYFATGNTSVNTHDAVYNISESAVNLKATLDSAPRALFTPPSYNDLDNADNDFGAGGIMLLPDNAFPVGKFAVIADKVTGMFLLNRSTLNAPSGTIANPNTSVTSCWCGESYWNGQVVSSAGQTLALWTPSLDGSGVPGLALANQVTVPDTHTGQPGGFLTSVSSNGTQSATGVIWVVTRPHSGTSLSLRAYNPTNLSTLSSETATPSPAAPGFIVPVVANGLVFVAAASQLSIFGLGGQ